MNLLRSLSRKLGRYQVKSNHEYGFECPRCSLNKGKYHLWVNLRKQVFNCFRCKFSGHLSKILGDEAMRNYKIEKVEDMKKILSTKTEIPEFIRLKISDPFPVARWCRRYLHKRRISPNRWMAMKVGYSLDQKIGGRLIIPIFEDGELIYYIARSIHMKDQPKELSPHTDSWPVRRSDVLYGYEEMTPEAPVVVVEGIFDCEHLRSHGYNAVALLGSFVSDTHVGKLLRKHPTKIIGMFDGDYAGQLAGIKLNILLSKRYKWKVDILKIGGDPDEMNDHQLAKYLAQDTQVWYPK